jgi:RNA polymerase subunit RPABC4/transcription elongation factor Spt4
MKECPKCQELVEPTENNKCPHCNTSLDDENFEIKDTVRLGE